MNTNQQASISFLVPSLTLGGAQSVCVNIANHFALRGWQVELVVLSLNNARYLDRVDSRIRLVDLNIQRARQAFSALFRHFSQGQQVICFSYELTLMLNAIRLLRHKKLTVIAYNPSTISNNNQNIQGNLKRWLLTRLILAFYDYADHIICQSNGIYQDFVTLYPRSLHKAQIIYNPVNLSIEEHANQIDWANYTKCNNIICVGRLEREKGLDFALRAFAQIHAQHPELSLKLIGTGSLQSSLDSLARELGIDHAVHFEGFQSNVTPFFLDAKLTLLTSHYEGLPNVLIESITLGTPIVAFDCPSGPKEIIVPDINGYLVNHLDLNDLVEKMHLALCKSWDYAQVHASASKFSSAQTLQAYQKLLAND